MSIRCLRSPRLPDGSVSSRETFAVTVAHPTPTPTPPMFNSWWPPGGRPHNNCRENGRGGGGGGGTPNVCVCLRDVKLARNAAATGGQTNLVS